MNGQFSKACIIEILFKKLFISDRETIWEGKYANNISKERKDFRFYCEAKSKAIKYKSDSPI